MTAPRAAKTTVRFIDEYCESYRNLFSDVRSFEAFKDIHIDMISELKRKSLPARRYADTCGIAELVGRDNPQGLQHFLNRSPWEVKEVRKYRIELLKKALRGRKITLIIDETGDPKQRLKEGDVYQTKPQIAAKMVRKIVELGFDIEMVLADSLYGESEAIFINTLEELKLNFIVAIRSNYGVWMPKGARVRANKWRKF